MEGTYSLSKLSHPWCSCNASCLPRPPSGFVRISTRHCVLVESYKPKQQTAKSVLSLGLPSPRGAFASGAWQNVCVSAQTRVTRLRDPMTHRLGAENL